MQNELDIVRDVSKRLDQAGIAYMLDGDELRPHLHQALDGEAWVG